MGVKRTIARFAALVTMLALMVSVVVVSQSTAEAGSAFQDDNGSPEEWAIKAIADAGITDGCGPALFCPDDSLTREQMATLFVRAFRLTDHAPSGFRDIGTSPHAADIEKLATAGITVGCEADAFCPGEIVTRAQMASLLRRAMGLRPISWRNTFNDDNGLAAEQDIEALANEGVTTGCGAGAYCPGKRVSRGQTAVLLARALRLGNEDPTTVSTAAPAAPSTSTTAGSSTSTTAGSSTSTAVASTSTTAAPSTSTTVASTTTPAVGGFPDASNTGVPAGMALKPSGTLTINTPGTVIDGYDVTGEIYVNVSDVTIRNTRVRSRDFAAIWVKQGVTGVVVEDCELDGSGTAGAGGSRGVSGPADVRRCNIYGVENGVVPHGNSQPIVVERNYIHGLAAPGSPHYDGIEIGVGSNITIRGNTVINDHGQTAAFGIWNDFGPVSNILVENNRFIGGGYTVYVRGDNGSWPVSGITIRNNRVGRGQWGYVSVVQASVSQSGNVDDTTGAPVNLN